MYFISTKCRFVGEPCSFEHNESVNWKVSCTLQMLYDSRHQGQQHDIICLPEVKNKRLNEGSNIQLLLF